MGMLINYLKPKTTSKIYVLFYNLSFTVWCLFSLPIKSIIICSKMVWTRIYLYYCALLWLCRSNPIVTIYLSDQNLSDSKCWIEFPSKEFPCGRTKMHNNYYHIWNIICYKTTNCNCFSNLYIEPSNIPLHFCKVYIAFTDYIFSQQ